MIFHPLQIAKIENITDDSVKISFELSSENQRIYDFLPGQYVTLEAEIDGTRIRRAYSICSTPNNPILSVGIKQISGGVFSTFANEKLQQGQVLNVSVPEGKFAFISEIYPENMVLIATGSGITPILSIIETALHKNNQKILLIYGNKTPESTMFLSEIERLKEDFSERFFVQYVFSKVHQKNELFGRIDADIVQYLLKSKYKSIDFERFYLCGHQQMVQAIKQMLQQQYDNKKIHTELFVTEPIIEKKYEGIAQVNVTHDRIKHSFELCKSKTILESLLEHQLEIPYSCQGGVCSSCMAKIEEGQAEMVKNQVLSEKEIQNGLILTCQAHPITDTLSINFDAI